MFDIVFNLWLLTNHSQQRVNTAYGVIERRLEIKKVKSGISLHLKSTNDEATSVIKSFNFWEKKEKKIKLKCYDQKRQQHDEDEEVE